MFFAYQIFNTLGYFDLNNQTLVGTIYISNYEESQYPSIISSEINNWKDKSTYKIIYQDCELNIDLDYFVIDTNSTISNISEGQNNQVYFTLSDDNRTLFNNDLIETFSNNIFDEVDIELLLSSINAGMENMNILKHYNLEDFFDSDLSSSLLDTIQISNIDSSDVDAITDYISSIDILSNERFSLLDTLNDNDLTNNQLSILASGLIKSTNKTPFSGYIFEQNQILPVWADEGLNVRILKTNNYDLSFYNNSDFDYNIEISEIDSTTLQFSLIGYPFVSSYSVSKIEEIIISHDTLYIDNDLLDETTTNIIIIDTVTETTYRLLTQTGADGKVLSYKRTETLPDLSEVSRVIFREIYYPISEIYEENIVLKVSD